MRRPMRRGSVLIRLTVVVAVAALGVGCSGDDEPAPDAVTTPAPSPTPTPTPPATAEPARTPAEDGCYDLSFDEAVSPTAAGPRTGCRGPHTSETFAVGRVDNVVDGHLLAVDSERVQAQVATTCPDRLSDVVGGSAADLRLSMLRAVWFTPSLEQSAAGAEWYRCDVVALAGAEALTTVRGSLAGVLDDAEGRERYGMCGTAAPDDAGFERVPCSAEHTWRAFSVIDLDAGRYPGAGAVTDAGAAPCEDAAAAVAEDPLDYEWGYEGPDADQWAMGQTFIRCWAPEA